VKYFTELIRRRQPVMPEPKLPDTTVFALMWRIDGAATLELHPDRQAVLNRARELRRQRVTMMRGAVVWRWTGLGGKQFVGREFIELCN
jgi:hypothetical protein